MTAYDELTPDALTLMADYSELDIVQMCADRGAALSALQEGEGPYDDERLIPTPGQWIWLWNRATPAERLEKVRYIQGMREQRDRVQSLARDWRDAQPLLPGQALADLCNALSDNPQPVMSQAVQAGDHLIRVTGDRVPTADERRAVGALLDATEEALDPDFQPGRLMARALGVGPAPCDSGRHDAHPDWDCDEQDALVKAWHKIFTDSSIRWADPPRSPGALAPLRKLAGQALAEGGALPGVRTFAEVMAYPEDPERCCVCGSDETPYENYKGQLFCWPCADGEPHTFKQVPNVSVAVCICDKWPGHHIHTGDRAACTCSECHPEEPTP